MKKQLLAAFLSLCLVVGPNSAKADFWGGDVIILTQILTQAIQTVLTLKSMLENGKDTLDLLHDVNAGFKKGLEIIHIIYPKFDPGVYGNLHDPNSVLQALQSVYGKIPEGSDQDLMQSQDQSVAEVISMNRNLYDYADQVDIERDQIILNANGVSPQGAGRLQNQALGILIGVTTQLLRTQGQMLKIMAQNMAYDNRKEKLASRNFQENYHGLSKGFKALPKETKLPRLGGGQ